MNNLNHDQQQKFLSAGTDRIKADDQLKEVFYGFGATVLGIMFLPSLLQKTHSFMAQTIKEGIGIVNQARCLAERTKEGIEDIIAEANFRQIQAKYRKKLEENSFHEE